MRYFSTNEEHGMPLCEKDHHIQITHCNGCNHLAKKLRKMVIFPSYFLFFGGSSGDPGVAGV